MIRVDTHIIVPASAQLPVILLKKANLFPLRDCQCALSCARLCRL